jgi:hypothetical protein
VDRRDSRCEGIAGLGAVELGERITDADDRRVVGSRVGIARPLVGEDVDELAGVLGRERGRLVDRHRRRFLVEPR